MLTWRPHGLLLSRGNFSPQLSLITLTLLLMMLLPACSGSGSGSSQTTVTVTLLDNMFSPKELHIKAGQTVVWVNKGQSVHTVTADDNSFDSGNLKVGAQFTHTFTQPGRYPYYCQIHGGAGGFGMAGVIIVDSSSNTGASGAAIRTRIERSPTMLLAATTTSIAPSITLGGLGLATPFFEILLGFYLYYLPLALYGAWLSVATWDIVRRDQMKTGARIGWMAVVYLIPVLGPLAYYLFSKSEIPRSTRYALAIGAPIVYLLVAVLLLFTVS